MENKEMSRREFLERAGKLGLIVAGGATLAACQTAAPAPEVPRERKIPVLEVYMPNEDREYQLLGGKTEQLFGATTPSGRVGTLGLGFLSNNIDPVELDFDMNSGVNYKVSGTSHAPAVMLSYTTPRNEDNTAFPLADESSLDLERVINDHFGIRRSAVDTTLSYGAIRIQNGDIVDVRDLIVPVARLPVQQELLTEDAYLRSLANELATNYGQMTQDGSLVPRSPEQVLGDLRVLQDYDKQIVSSWARPATDRDELIVRGISGDNSLTYGFVAHGMSPLEATMSKQRMKLTDGYFSQRQYDGSQ